MTSIYNEPQEIQQQERGQIAARLKLADHEVESTALETLRFGLLTIRNSNSLQDCTDIGYAMHNLPDALSKRDLPFLRDVTIEAQWALWKIRTLKIATKSAE
jgi:hypothetical protein